MHRLLTTLLTVGAALALTAGDAQAQGLGDRLKKKAQQAAEGAVERRTERRAGEATDAALDKAENTVKCAATDKACKDKAKAAGKKVVEVDENGKPIKKAGGAAATAASPDAAGEKGEAGGETANRLRPGEGAWANYDFKPGDRIIYADDFKGDEVGDFPRRMEFQTGALEIVEWQGTRFLRANQDSRWHIPLPEVLPQRFTLEFDFMTPDGELWMWFGDDQNKRVTFSTYYRNTKVHNGATGIDAQGEFAPHGATEATTLRRGRILGDGRYIKVYVDDKRILNVPNADFERTNKISFWVDAALKEQALFGNVRIAAGGKKLYDALAETGRVATQGIYFDTGSDRIRPESSPTLKEIAAMLKEHPDLKLTIEGHTDNVGAAAANQSLSEKRAAAVKASLVADFGVDEGRLVSKGLGASKPAASNDTPEGKQQNRRVELVKM